MAHLPVQCQNCGARYKIPETFKSDVAKCKGCGTMIDVKSVRDAGGAEAPEAVSKPRSTGGTRKPRATASSAKTKAAETDEAPARRSSRRSGGDEESPRGSRGRRDAAGGGRRSRRGEDDGEDGGGRFEKKKDNTGMIAAVSIGALLIVGLVAYFAFFTGEDPVEDPNKPKVAAGENGGAEKPTDKPEDAAKDGNKEADASSGGDAKAADAGSGKSDGKPVEGDAKKKPKKKKTKKKKPAPKKDAPKATVTKPEDVYKPASDLEQLPLPEDVTEEELDEANSALDALTEGSGLAYIRAPRKLQELGYKILPIVANRLRGLDYTKAKDNQYAFALADRVIKPITHWEFGFEQSKIADDFKLQAGHGNALRVKAVHQHARVYWANAEAWEKYKKKYASKFK